MISPDLIIIASIVAATVSVAAASAAVYGKNRRRHRPDHPVRLIIMDGDKESYEVSEQQANQVRELVTSH
jgi:hypothetical protein